MFRYEHFGLTSMLWTNIHEKAVVDVPWCGFFFKQFGTDGRLVIQIPIFILPFILPKIVFPQKVMLSTAFQTFLTGLCNN